MRYWAIFYGGKDHIHHIATDENLTGALCAAQTSRGEVEGYGRFQIIDSGADRDGTRPVRMIESAHAICERGGDLDPADFRGKLKMVVAQAEMDL